VILFLGRGGVGLTVAKIAIILLQGFVAGVQLSSALYLNAKEVFSILE